MAARRRVWASGVQTLAVSTGTQWSASAQTPQRIELPAGAHSLFLLLACCCLFFQWLSIMATTVTTRACSAWCLSGTRRRPGVRRHQKMVRRRRKCSPCATAVSLRRPYKSRWPTRTTTTMPSSSCCSRYPTCITRKVDNVRNTARKHIAQLCSEWAFGPAKGKCSTAIHFVCLLSLSHSFDATKSRRDLVDALQSTPRRELADHRGLRGQRRRSRTAAQSGSALPIKRARCRSSCSRQGNSSSAPF